MMYTIFIEYRIQEQFKAEYLKELGKIQKDLNRLGITEYQYLQATEQPNLYVEMVQLSSLTQYEQWKDMLRSKELNFPWTAIMDYIAGGYDRFQMWAFVRRDT